MFNIDDVDAGSTLNSIEARNAKGVAFRQVFFFIPERCLRLATETWNTDNKTMTIRLLEHFN